MDRQRCDRVGPDRGPVAITALALAAALFPAVLAPAASAAPTSAKVDRRVLREARAGGTATYWALLRQKADLSPAGSIRGWTARGWFVVKRLRSVANSSQRGLRAFLRNRGATFTPYWIINAVRIRSAAATLEAVAARPEVARVVPDWSARVETMAQATSISTIEWNIQKIRAPEVWSQYNDRGQGITVASIDTGVQWNHPALIKQYRGQCAFLCLTVNHNYNWYDPSHVCPQPAPCDNVSHGTAVMGVAVGDDRTGNQIGVAPRAYWIAAKGCENTGCSDSALMMSGQWMLAPRNLNDQNPRPDLRPDVILNPWGGNGSDPFYRATVQAWVAAGIFPLFSVGASGPGCGTVGAPASYPESYGVGAFDMNDNIASFSSRGPSPFGGIVKPNVTAPGVSIRTSVPNNGYAVFSGTSVATSHAAGTVALIWAGALSFRRDVAGTRSVLDQTAIDASDLSCGGSPGNNNVWGEGRLDAFAAVTKAKGLSEGADRPR